MSMEKKTNQHAIPLRCLAFLVIFCLLFVFVSYLVRPTGGERRGFQGFYAEKQNSCDVVYIGGSVSISCWAPYVAWKETGIASYAYGMSWTISSMIKPIIEETYKMQSPQLFIIDLRPFQYSTEITEEKVIRRPADMMPYSVNRYKLLEKNLPLLPPEDRTDMLSYYLDIIKYHGNWQSLNQDSFTYTTYGTKRSDTKGFLFAALNKPLELDDNTGVTETASVAAIAESDLREVLSYLKKTNQKALFVVTTYDENGYERMQYNYLQNIIEANGFDYFNANDYNAVMDMDADRDYYDANHTNIYGAEKYTAFLANYIDEKYDLPDRREDPAYSDWYAGYERWVELSDATKSEITALIEQRETEENPSE